MTKLGELEGGKGRGFLSLFCLCQETLCACLCVRRYPRCSLDFEPVLLCRYLRFYFTLTLHTSFTRGED